MTVEKEVAPDPNELIQIGHRSVLKSSLTEPSEQIISPGNLLICGRCRHFTDPLIARFLESKGVAPSSSSCYHLLSRSNKRIIYLR